MPRLGVVVALLAALCPAQDRTVPGDQPVELGAIAWLRDFDAAVREAKNRRVPILALFQEVPG